MTADDIYVGYVTKNALNILRQNYGYKEGAYKKMWNEREDNVVVFEIASKLNPDSSLMDNLYKKIERYYVDFVVNHDDDEIGCGYGALGGY